MVQMTSVYYVSCATLVQSVREVTHQQNMSLTAKKQTKSNYQWLLGAKLKTLNPNKISSLESL